MREAESQKIFNDVNLLLHILTDRPSLYIHLLLQQFDLNFESFLQQMIPETPHVGILDLSTLSMLFTAAESIAIIDRLYTPLRFTFVLLGLP